jgi:hypothetical protein
MWRMPTEHEECQAAASCGRLPTVAVLTFSPPKERDSFDGVQVPGVGSECPLSNGTTWRARRV